MSHVLDTNVVLYHLSGGLAGPLPPGPLIVSIVTEIVLLAFKALTREESEGIRAFISGITVVPLDESLKQSVIDMRLTGLRLPDAIVAATALANGAEHDAHLLRLASVVVSAPSLKQR